MLDVGRVGRLSEKIAEADETIDLGPQVESDGDPKPSEIRTVRAKCRRQKMRKLHAKRPSKSQDREMNGFCQQRFGNAPTR